MIFDHFICIWRLFLSLFVFMFSTYFFFHCLNMFCVEKTGVRVFRGSAGNSLVAKPQSRVHLEAFSDSLMTREIFATEPRDSPSRERPEIAF